MATEIESAWSPAKRFTLVKPTFKGLEQAFIPLSAGSAYGPGGQLAGWKIFV